MVRTNSWLSYTYKGSAVTKSCLEYTMHNATAKPKQKKNNNEINKGEKSPPRHCLSAAFARPPVSMQGHIY